MRLSFIGGGVMAEAMIRGILRERAADPRDISVSDILRERLEFLQREFGISPASDNIAAACEGDVVILAVKPQVLREVMEELRGKIRGEKLVLSIVAGAPIKLLQSGLEHPLIIRAMPNLPAQIGEGVTVWTAAEAVDSQKREIARRILRGLGEEIYVPDEEYVEMATAISGSGPAFLALVLESLIDAGVHLGLPLEIARKLAMRTALGTFRILKERDLKPEELRRMVSSPGGTTVEGILQLEERGVRGAFIRAALAAYEKSKRLIW